ncbi:MAG TPA: hypothetical protein VM074_05270 [Solimonas sp.]|nr:hypothetical protein [Solimonas sp.]
MTHLSKLPSAVILCCLAGSSAAQTGETCVVQPPSPESSASATCAPDRLFAAPAPYSVSVKPAPVQDALGAATPDRQQPGTVTPALVVTVEF